MRLRFEKYISKQKMMEHQMRFLRQRTIQEQEEDPVLPEQHHTHNQILSVGNFKSRYNPNYTFFYLIHYDGNDEALTKKCQFPEISYSLFVKTPKPKPIWQYHRFSKDVIDALYPADETDSLLTKSSKL